jgi:hypothetical protein
MTIFEYLFSYLTKYILALHYTTEKVKPIDHCYSGEIKMMLTYCIISLELNSRPTSVALRCIVPCKIYNCSSLLFCVCLTNCTFILQV